MKRLLAVVLASTLMAATASGAPRSTSVATRDTSTDEAKQEARALATQAALQYDVGKFSEALGLYRKAYALYPAPGLLFNIGQCYSQLRDWNMAIFEYEAYLRKLPDAPNRRTVQELVSDARHASQMQHRWCATGAVDLTTSTLPRPRPARNLHTRWWFWTAVGALAASTVVVLESRF